jgi:hypothetical protein
MNEIARCELSARVIHADTLEWCKTQQDNSVDAVICSPPYEDARTYGIGFNLKGQEFVDWCVTRFMEHYRISRGVVCWVIEGKTKDFRWSATPALLMADLHRAGVNLRKPPIFNRVGIPGSGGPDWWRNDYEFCICATKNGKLPWSDNTATGHPPKWAPGGEMSNRTTNGRRVNQSNPQPSLFEMEKNEDGVYVNRDEFGFSTTTSGGRYKDGTQKPRLTITRPREGQHTPSDNEYVQPTLANPGNVIKATYTADEVRQLLAACGVADEAIPEVVKCIVGGGVMGSKLAHENEAPFPESLVEPYVKCFCPPGGLVYDPFSGSGTTGAVCIKNGRNFIGTDIRESQVELTNRRFAEALASLGLSAEG